MQRFIRVIALLAVLAIGLVMAACRSRPIEGEQEPAAAVEPVAEATTAAEEEFARLELEPFTNDAMGISGVVPQGWNEAAPGVYARGDMQTDLTAIIQQAAPDATVAQVTAALLPNLGLQELPESVGTYESDAFTWDLYTVEVEAPGTGTIVVDIALVETDAATYLIMLQAMSDEYTARHEEVFLPAVDALAPLSTVEEAVYEDPSGLFSIPILTNWTAESADGYGILHGPDDKITVYVLAAEGEDVEAAIAEAWALADPEFGQPIADVVEPPATGGVEKFVVITYDNAGDETKFVQAIGQLHEGTVYTLLFQGDPTAFQKRVAQISIIISGFNISALEEVDLIGVEPLPLTDDLLTELEAYIVDAMERLGVPGAAVAIVQGDEVVYAEGFGVRERDKDDPVTPETLMMIGSTTKTMTTMMMATLVDEGLIEWDTPVINILPTFAVADPELTQTITMRNLVCACTGVPRRDFEILFNANDLSAEGIIESLADFESFTDFGEAFQYSNQMVATGGYVAALAAGGEYGDLYDAYVATMQERIFTPIGMTHSTFSLEEVQTSDNYATPHGLNLDFEYEPFPLSFEEWLRPIASSGTLWSTVLDMARYVITELNEGVAPDGTRVVSTKNLAITWEPQVAISSEASYGLGWIVDEYKGLRVLGHGGNTTGFTSDLAFLPEADLGISVLTNQSGSFLNQAIRFRLLELLYQQEPEYDVQVQFAIDRAQEAVAEVVEQLKDSADPDAVAPYVGLFTNEVLGEIIVELRDGTLILDAGEFQVELRPQVDEDGEVTVYQVVTTGVPLLGFEFTEDDDGNPTIVYGRGVAEYTFEKVQ